MAKDQDLETLSLFMTKRICEHRAKQTLLWHFPQQCLDAKEQDLGLALSHHPGGAVSTFDTSFSSFCKGQPSVAAGM